MLIALYFKNIQKYKDLEEQIINNKKLNENYEKLNKKYIEFIASVKESEKTYSRTNIALTLLLLTSIIFNIKFCFK